MRLREKDVRICIFCKWRIYHLPSTTLWYDFVHHEFHCPDEDNPSKIHQPKKVGTE